MSVSIISQPAAATLSSDAALFVVSGSNFASGNYRYVADVSGTALLSRLKCDKLPNNQGFFNVARVVETLVPIDKPAVAFYSNPLIASRYTIGFREEFGTPPVVASGVTTASGIVFQGYKREWESFVAGNYFASDETAKILSKQPIKRKARLGENDFVSVLLAPATGSLSYTITIETAVRTFSVTGTIASGQLSAMFNTGLAGIYSLTSGQTSDSQAGSYLMAGISRYTVKVEYIRSIATTYVSEDWVGQDFTIEYEVESCKRFVPQRLFFRNSLGGYDGYTFTMKNRKTGNMSKQTFGKNTDVFGTKTAERVYSGEFDEVMTFNSDWLTDANWMSELIYSPQVYLQIGSELVEAIVNTLSFQFHTRPQDKLQQIQVDVKIAYQNRVI